MEKKKKKKIDIFFSALFHKRRRLGILSIGTTFIVVEDLFCLVYVEVE